MFNLNQQNQFNQPFNMNNINNINMNQAMMNMNQLTGWNFNVNQAAQFAQMINSNPMYLMMWNQMVANMQNSQLMQMNNPGIIFQGGAAGNNQFANINNVQGNALRININFLTADGRKVVIQTEPNEPMTSVINKYINKSLDFNSNNYYIFNNKRIVQQLTVAELGLNDGAEVHVINTGSVNGGVFL